MDRSRLVTAFCLLLLIGGCFEEDAGVCDLTRTPAPWEDADGDGYVGEDDCDDDAIEVNPSATEVCDGIDNDCDGTTDGPESADATVYYLDEDGDGYGDAGTTTTACATPADYSPRAGDCDDSDPAFHPGATEDDCTDPNDYDCDGSASGEDADGDGYFACEDCDDSDAGVSPDATEICDEVDDDCDGLIDDEDDSLADASTWYADGDEDGYGDPSSTTAACTLPAGYTDDDSDCDDTDGGIHPGAVEVCDAAGTDEDCDGSSDDEDSDASGKSTWYLDEDADGYGDPSTTIEACDAPEGYGEDATDCDDSDASVNPGAAETCDSLDDDCDGLTDDDDPSLSGASLWYTDGDGDGYGDALGATSACVQPSGTVADATDCDDSDASISPAATEVDDDGVDSDCDGYDPATDSIWTLDECSEDGGISLVVKSNGAFGACVVSGSDFDGEDPSCSWRPPLLVASDGTEYELRTASTTNDVQLSDSEATSKILVSGLTDLDIEIDQVVSGTTLTQTYTFTNNGATDLDYAVYRTADPDLDYGFQAAHPYTSSSPEPQPAVGSCPSGDVEYGGRCCPDFNPTCTSSLYNTRKGYPGFNVPWEIDGDPAACSYDRLDDPTGGHCVAEGDGGGDAIYDGYRMVMGQSNGSAIHAHLGYDLGFYVQARQETTTVRYVLKDDGSDEYLSDLPQDVPVGDPLPGIDWDYAFGVGGAGDIGILLSWQLHVGAGESATLVTTTDFYPAAACP